MMMMMMMMRFRSPRTRKGRSLPIRILESLDGEHGAEEGEGEDGNEQDSGGGCASYIVTGS